MKAEEYESYKQAKEEGTEEAMAIHDEKWGTAPYSKAEFERQMEADANDGQIMVYTEGQYEGLTRGEAEIRASDTTLQNIEQQQQQSEPAPQSEADDV